MAARKTMFLVVFFSKNRRLLMALAALAAIVLAVWLIVFFTNWLVTVNHQEETLEWTVISDDKDWQGVSDGTLPKFFVAGGITYDQHILVDGWGMSAEALVPVDYMEDLGIHVLYGQISKITYIDRRLEVHIQEQQSGYKLITVAKTHFNEGDLQVVFMDSKGVPMSYEEEYIYSIPLNYTMVEAGEAETKAAVFMEVLNTESLPVLTGLDISLLHRHQDKLLLYIQGGEVATIQRNQNTVRVYVNNNSVYQVIALDYGQMVSGQNIIRLIDSNDLQVKSQINLLIPDK